MLNYFLSKFGPFMNNATMRCILGQHENSLDFGELMQSGRIVLANLSKGKLGEINAHMLGLILISRLQAAVMRRAAISSDARRPFYLYVDEFQNFSTDTFMSLLSESRKYGLGVHLTNQYLMQLPESIRDSVLGNVGTILSFEVSAEDAKLLAGEFAPMTEQDFLGLPRYNFYIKLLISGKTSPVFSGKSLPPEPEDFTSIEREKVIALNRLAYGYPRMLVEETTRRHLAA